MRTLSRSIRLGGAVANGSVLNLDLAGQRESLADCRCEVCDAVATRQQISARGDPALAGETLVRCVDVRHPEGMAEMALPARHPAPYLEGPDRAYARSICPPGVLPAAAAGEPLAEFCCRVATGNLMRRENRSNPIDES
jgi:hypothetical protein